MRLGWSGVWEWDTLFYLEKSLGQWESILPCVTEEAPPSYKQLFGDKNKEAGTQASDRLRRPRVRPHTQSRRRLRNEQSTNTRSTRNVLDWLRGKIPRVTNRLAIGCKLCHCLLLHSQTFPHLCDCLQCPTNRGRKPGVSYHVICSADIACLHTASNQNGGWECLRKRLVI